MRAADLLIWHPRVEQSADPHQGELFHDADGGPLPAAVLPEWIARAAAAAELDARPQWGLRRLLRALGRGWCDSAMRARLPEMNWRRGVLRVWVICTIVWIGYRSVIWNETDVCVPQINPWSCIGEADLANWYYYYKAFFQYEWLILISGALVGLAAIYVGAWVIAGFKR